MDAPRDDLTRSVSFELERGTNGDGLTLTGYAAMFDTPTRIDSWEGKFDEQISRGAFRKTLRERMPVLQFDHGHDSRTGSVPIGAISALKEDKQGLHVTARLHDNDLVKPIRDAIESGAIDGMSFRFQVVKDEWDESGDVPLRTIKEVRLMELGPVVFPAYASTSVGVRSQEGLCPRCQTQSTRDEADAPATSDEPPATTDEPLPESTPGLTPGERARVLRDLELQELFT